MAQGLDYRTDPRALEAVRRRWRLLLVAAFAAGLATFSLLALLVFDRLQDPGWLAVVLLVNAVGDLIAAAAAQLMAPTRIRLRPGETETPEAVIQSGFGERLDGHVVTAGERWRARLAPGAPAAGPGDRVLVVDRDGLTLVVAPVPGTGASTSTGTGTGARTGEGG